MKWPLVAGATVLVIVALFFLFGSRDVPQATREGPIIAMGDSLVYGTGSTGGGFVKMLESRIGEKIENLGTPGNTTADDLARIDAVIEKHPKVVILLTGGNDYLRRIPEEQTFSNIASIIERLQADGAVVLLLGVRGGLLRDNFAEKYEDLADQYETGYVRNVLKGILFDPRYMADQVHPNDAGYQEIADRVYPVLAKMLK